MRRKFIGTTTMLAFLLALFAAVPAGAHTVSVSDKTRTDWFGKGPPEPNIGAIARDASGRGEFVWTDAKGDQRLASTIGATGEITREADLTRFSVTADATNIYFLTRVEHYSGIRNDPALQVMISIDRDQTAGSGNTALPDDVNTNVAGSAAWEYVVQSRFTKGTGGTGEYSVNAQPWVYSSPAVTETVGAGQLVSASAAGGSYAEIAVPWDKIGGLPAPQSPLRFTVSTYYSDHRAPAGDVKAIDVLSSASASAELANGTIDYSVDLHFNAAGEIFAPLLISEFLPDPDKSTDPDGEWIEIYNPNAFDVSLNGYKLGDQAYRDGSQGMLLLPNRVLAAGGTLVVANNVAKFNLAFPGVPAAQVVEMKNLAPYTSWASGNISLQNKNDGLPFKESIALLDPNDTIVDLVQYAYKTAAGPTGLDPDNKPIVLSGPTVAANASYDRCPSAADTNDGGLDFFVRASGQTPGLACSTVPGIDLRIAKEGPESVPNAQGTPIQYVIPFSNAGASAAQNVVITDTLPAQLVFVGQSATPGVVFAGQNGRTLTWTIVNLPSQASGSITLDVAVAAGVLADTPISNSAGIASTPAEAVATRHNNVAVQTLITAGPADLTVFSTWAQASGTRAGQPASFTIFYQNLGEEDASNITIVDRLPANVTFVGADPQPKSVVGNVLTWSVPSLSYLDTGSIKVDVRLGAALKPGAKLENVLDISSDPADLDRAGEQPDQERAMLTVGQGQLFLPIARK